ncbi:MAG: NAD-dependent epimerase/dehydratase family protein [Verrucomicrobia bacterium]|nr:NAD-dependent epimerase/dehydratase family protein [Verrucomicrobiota bacterium]MBV8485864.1 NAD-dependent epimerase/dehydratase family protein [Verrucomicrobiota bacterium]
MKIVVIGATGTIGTAVANALEPKHQVVRVSRTGPTNADLKDSSSIDALFESAGTVEAVVSCAASVPLTPLFSLSGTAAAKFCKAKLLGQLHLVHVALNRLGKGNDERTGPATGESTNARNESVVTSKSPSRPIGRGGEKRRHRPNCQRSNSLEKSPIAQRKT